MTTFTLPYPPSTNRIWRRAGHRIYLAPDGVKFRAAVLDAVTQQGFTPFTEVDRLCVRIEATMPDRRARDLDNLFKSTLDALMHAGVFPDDSQIDDLSCVRKGVKKPGEIVIHLSSICKD